MNKNEEEHFNNLDPYDKSYAMFHLYITIKSIIKKVFSFIWYYL